MNVAIISARGRIKRIPLKNIRKFRGNPMTAHSILAALDSTSFVDEVIVFTDDEEITSVAFHQGASIPIRRLPELADEPVDTQPYYRALYDDQCLPEAEQHCLRRLSLTLCPDLAEADVDPISQALCETLKS